MLFLAGLPFLNKPLVSEPFTLHAHAKKSHSSECTLENLLHKPFLWHSCAGKRSSEPSTSQETTVVQQGPKQSLRTLVRHLHSVPVTHCLSLLSPGTIATASCITPISIPSLSTGSTCTISSVYFASILFNF